MKNKKSKVDIQSTNNRGLGNTNGIDKLFSGPRKKKQIREMRQASRILPSGEKESHKMAWVGDPNKKRGNFGVFPTITPKPGKEKSTDPKDWKTQSMKEAMSKGEFIEVKSRKRAEKLAAGSWKRGKDRVEAMKEYRKSKKN
jgi:hypothetical protein